MTSVAAAVTPAAISAGVAVAATIATDVRPSIGTVGARIHAVVTEPQRRRDGERVTRRVVGVTVAWAKGAPGDAKCGQRDEQNDECGRAQLWLPDRTALRDMTRIGAR